MDEKMNWSCENKFNLNENIDDIPCNLNRIEIWIQLNWIQIQLKKNEMQIGEGIENVLMNMMFQKKLSKNSNLKSSMPLSWILVWPVPLTQVWTHQNINSTKPE